MNTNQNIDALVNATVLDRDGDKIGKVGQLYLDDNSGQPSWVTVSTGLFGTKETFVPLQDAQVSGDEIRVPYEKSFIKDAPNVDVDQHLSPAEEEELYRYYRLEGAAGTRGTDTTRDHDRTAAGTAAAGTAAGTAGLASHDRTDRDRTDREFTDRDRTRGDDGSVTAYEERLNVGTEQREAGKARLRKHVVTENQTVQVPVQHEELRVERENLNGERATGHRIGEDSTDETITLHEERPVVDKETVATERVHVGKETVTDTETVQANLKREEIEVDEAGTSGRRGFDNDTTGTRGTTTGTGRVGGDRDGDGDRDLKDKAGDMLDRDKDGKIGR